MSRLVAVVALVAAVVLLAGLTASTRGEAAEDLATTVESAAPGTSVVLAGTSVPARRGTAVPAGAAVVTTGGAAVLHTGRRTTTLAPSTRLVVLDGAKARLEAGTVLVDATRGRALAVTTSAARVGVPDKALVRVEAVPVLRVAAYRGTASVHPAGRRSTTTVGALHQVRVPAGALPGRVTPLALVDGDPWERASLRSLVDADLDLRALAVDLAIEGPASRALPAALTDQDLSSAALGELSLAVALAHRGDRVRPQVLEDVVEGRRLGGSWGVVARLAGATVQDASDYLAGLTPAQREQALADVVVPSGGLLPFVAPAVPRPSTAPAAPTASRAPSAAPTQAPDAAPSPGGSPGPVRELLQTVLDLLPLQPGAQQAPAPAVSPTRPPLLDVHLDLPVLTPLLG